MLKKHSSLKFIISLLTVIFISCSDYTGTDNKTYSYPLEIGNNWVYEDTVIVENFTLDSTMILISEIKKEVTGKVFLENGIETYEVKSTSVIDTSINISYKYLNNSDSQLVEYDFINGYPRKRSEKNHKVNYIFKNNKFSSISELQQFLNNFEYSNSRGLDSLISGISITLLKYPLAYNTKWIFTKDSSTAEVISLENIKTSAGTFMCWKVKYSNNDNEYYSYYSNEGLIYKEQICNDISFLDEEGNNIGVGKISIKRYLKEWNIVED